MLKKNYTHEAHLDLRNVQITIPYRHYIPCERCITLSGAISTSKAHILRACQGSQPVVSGTESLPTPHYTQCANTVPHKHILHPVANACNSHVDECNCGLKIAVSEGREGPGAENLPHIKHTHHRATRSRNVSQKQYILWRMYATTMLDKRNPDDRSFMSSPWVLVGYYISHISHIILHVRRNQNASLTYYTQ